MSPPLFVDVSINISQDVIDEFKKIMCKECYMNQPRNSKDRLKFYESVFGLSDDFVSRVLDIIDEMHNDNFQRSEVNLEIDTMVAEHLDISLDELDIASDEYKENK